MKDLIVYFSVSHNTEKFANKIKEITNGDIVQLEPVKPYSKYFIFRTIRAKREQSKNVNPEFKELNINLNDYDRIFIGYPIWWYTMPMIIYNFLSKNDLSNKVIVPFNTHEGSGTSGTYKTIQQLCPNSKVLDGLAIEGVSMKKDQTERIRKWLEGLN